jgi:hypothetical protein
MAVAVLTLGLWVGLMVSTTPVYADETTPTDETAIVDETTPTDETATVDETTPTDETTTVDETAPTDETAIVDETTPTDETAIVDETAPADETTTVDETAPTDEAAPVDEAVPADEEVGHTYTAEIDPTSIQVGETEDFTITFTEVGTSTSIGSATVDVPFNTAYADDASLIVATSGDIWTATWDADHHQIDLQAKNDSNKLSQNQWVSVTFTATAPRDTGTYTFDTTAYKNTSYGGGTDTLKSGTSEPQVTVTAPDIGLAPSADSYVDQDHAGTNYGDSDKLHVKFQKSDEQRITYIEIDLSTLPSDATIDSAVLYLYRYADYGVPVAYSISDDSWTETGITWNNMPSLGANIANGQLSGDKDDEQWIAWSIKDYVQSEYDGDQILTVALKFATKSNDDEHHADFYSDEDNGDYDHCGNQTRSPDPPYLAINYTLVPTAIVTFYQSGVGGDFSGTVATIIDEGDYNGAALTTGVAITRNIGDTITFTYHTNLTTDGTRYVWTSTTGGLTSDQSGTLVVSGNGSVIGNYQTQYYLTVDTNPASVNTPTGEGWYDANTYPGISTDQYEDIVTGESRYRFDGWTTDGVIGEIADPSALSTTVYLDQVKTVTANYVTQYYLTVNSPYGLPTTGEDWYDDGEPAYAGLTSGLESGHSFVEWTDDASGTDYLQSNVITMNEPKTATAIWAPIPPLGATAIELVLSINWFGTILYYPVDASGALLVDVNLTSPDGTTKLVMPAGTRPLDENGLPLYLHPDADITVTMAGTPPAPPGTTIVAVYEILPSGITFENGEAQLIVTYDPATVAPGSVVVIAYYDETAGEWVELETAGYVIGGETVPNTVIAHFTHTTYFALLVKLPK